MMKAKDRTTTGPSRRCRSFLAPPTGRGATLPVLALLLVTACTPASPAPSPQAKPNAAASTSGGAPTGTVTIGLSSIGADERWLPWLGGVGDHQVSGAVYDYLLGREPGTDKLEPRLAERYEWSADNRMLTLYIRRGVPFHDGKGELTAEDVKFSLEKYMATDRAPGTPYFREVIDTITVPDPYRVELRLKRPDWSLPSNLANATARIAIVSKAYVEAVGEDQASERPIGTGPFRYLEGQRRSMVRLEAVDNHWRQTASMRTLILKQIPENGTRVAALRTGEADIVDILHEQIAELSGSEFTLLPIKHAGSVWITLGGLNGPDHKFTDPSVPWVGPDPERALLVRKALSLAVDRKAILDKIYAGQGDLVAVPGFRPGMPWTDTALQPYPYDPTQAKALLAQAGYPNGFPIKIMSLTGQSPEFPQLTEAVAGYWTRNLGLRVEIAPVEWATFRPKMVARDTVGITWPHWIQSNMDPEPAGTYINQWTCDGNYIAVACDKDVDKLFESLMVEPSDAKRVDIRKQIAQIVYDDYYFVPIAQVHRVFAANARKVIAWPLVPGSVYPVNYEYMQIAR
jgi:peptide/nickel transport system substrate-binding protein